MLYLYLCSLNTDNELTLLGHAMRSYTSDLKTSYLHFYKVKVVTLPSLIWSLTMQSCEEL